MKASQLAKRMLPEDKFTEIIAACQSLIYTNSVGVTVSKELDESDEDIIVEVVHNLFLDDPNLEKASYALAQRTKGLFTRYLQRQNKEPNNVK